VRRVLFLKLIVGLIIIGCASSPELTKMEPDAAYRYLESQFNKGKYQAAVDGLNFFTLNYSGSALVDSAQFMLAQAHLNLKEYLLAAEAFLELTQRFPRSPLVSEAMFFQGHCYYKLSPRYDLDQEYTNRAIEALQTFIDFYPDYRVRTTEAERLIALCRDKLAQKDYMAGMIYFKMKNFMSAAIYFQSVIDKYYDLEWSAKAAFYLGQTLAADERGEDAKIVYRQFLVKYPDHPWRAKVEIALKKLP